MDNEDFVRELARIPSHASLSSEDLDGLAKRASNLYLSQETPLTDAVVKVAQEAKGISPEQVKRVVERANVATYQRLFEKGGSDRNVQFTIADPSAVLRQLNSTAAPIMKVASADYAARPPTPKASTLEADIELCALFGVQPAPTKAMEKTALSPLQRLALGGAAGAGLGAVTAGEDRRLQGALAGGALGTGAGYLGSRGGEGLEYGLRAGLGGAGGGAVGGLLSRDDPTGESAHAAALIARGLLSTDSATRDRDAQSQYRREDRAAAEKVEAQKHKGTKCTNCGAVGDSRTCDYCGSAKTAALDAPKFFEQDGQLFHEFAPGVQFSIPLGPKADEYKRKVEKEHGFVGSTAPTRPEDPLWAKAGKSVSRRLDAANPNRPRYASLKDFLLRRPDPNYRPGAEVLQSPFKTAMIDHAKGQAALEILAAKEQTAKAQKKVIEMQMTPPEPVGPPNMQQLSQGMRPPMVKMAGNQAMAYVKAGRPDADLVLQDLESMYSTDAIKQAAQVNEQQYPSAEPFSDLYRVRQLLVRQDEDLSSALAQNGHLIKIAHDALNHAIVQHVLSGGNLGEAVHLMSGMAGPEKTKEAMQCCMSEFEQRFAPHQLTSLQSDLIRYEMEKGASVRIANMSNPIARSFAGLLKVAEDRAVLLQSLTTIKGLLDEANTLTAQAMEQTARAA